MIRPDRAWLPYGVDVEAAHHYSDRHELIDRREPVQAVELEERGLPLPLPLARPAGGRFRVLRSFSGPNTVRNMYTVEASAVLNPGRHLTDEEITDLIEAAINDLDTTTADPSMGTVRDGDNVRMTVSVAVEGSNPFAALARASEAILAALYAAGVAVECAVSARDLRSEVRLLQSS